MSPATPSGQSTVSQAPFVPSVTVPHSWQFWPPDPVQTSTFVPMALDPKQTCVGLMRKSHLVKVTVVYGKTRF